MARYADIEKIEKLLVQGIDENGDAIVSLRDVRKAITQAENAYVVEVVRCKDCKYFRDRFGENEKLEWEMRGNERRNLF